MFDKRFGIDSGNGKFSSGVDIGDGHVITGLKANGKLIKEIFDSGIAVWLEHHSNFRLREAFVSRLKSRANLGGMVRVIVDEKHSFDFSPIMKAPLDASK